MNVAARPVFASGISSPRSLGLSLHSGAPTVAPPTSTPYEYRGPTAIIARPVAPILTTGSASSPQLPIGVPRANPVFPANPIVNNGSVFVMNFSGTGGSLGAPVASPNPVSPRHVGAGLFA